MICLIKVDNQNDDDNVNKDYIINHDNSDKFNNYTWMQTPLQLIARFEVAYEGRNLIWMFEAWYIGALVDLTTSLSNHRHHVTVLLDLVALNLAAV